VAERHPAPTRDTLTGLVLAGGRGQRMGGVDKGLLTWQGRPLVLHALERLRPQVAHVAVSANRHLSQYEALGVAVWPDRVPGYPGPLAGWQAALQAMPTPWLASVPCDTPTLPLDTVTRLATAAAAQGAPAAYAVAGGRAHPVVSLLHASLRPALDRALDEHRLRVLDWLDGVQAVAVPFDAPGDATAFANLNRPEDLSPSPG
jgi:molybdopterin-guanine dinucleotide biosynthesis protein A